MGDVDGGGRLCVGAVRQGVYRNSLSFLLNFCCEPQTALKNKVYFSKGKLIGKTTFKKLGEFPTPRPYEKIPKNS